jgi:sarcosine oxidase
MGSAAAYRLSERGGRVLGLDRFHPPHELGSSHGLTRIIREAYFEHPLYVPLVQRAYQLWADLEERAGRRLLLQTGGVMIGRREGVLVSGALRSAREHGLAHELLSAAELRRRWPAFEPEEEMVGVWETRAGILYPELVIRTHLELAAKLGATLRFDEPMLNWETDGEGVRVTTAAGSWKAARLLLTTGAWMGASVGDLRLPLTVERQVLAWFEPRALAEAFKPQSCPIHLWEYEPGRFFYGFPDLGDGVKVAIHHQGENTNPDEIRREVGTEDIEALRQVMRRFLPAADGPLRSASVCMYTNSPDEHFILDRHPAHRQVLIASPCSGHGFKFSPVIGELAADLLEERVPGFDLSLFRLESRLPRGVA